ncbi:MAG: hypothetical protein RLP09_36510 [Sandaracinaceae bacterium]|nr:hypothetical protein [Myxococcales bacterium]
MKWRFLMLVAALGLGLVACGEETTEETETVEAEAPPEEAVAEPTADEIPVAEDFAAEAEAQIDEENYQAELERIEAELAAN